MIKVTQEKILLDTEEHIVTSCISSPTEIVFLLSNGSVFRYDRCTKKEEELFSVHTSMSYTDGGFDLESSSTLYTLDNIVVVANDYKFHAIVHYPGKYKNLRLQREDYYADITKYPIALFKDDKGVPHIIYGTNWNHVQILNLSTRQLLTATKSLIEVGAEEQHIEYYKTHEEKKFCDDIWPRSHDYFFGELSMSPNNQYFLSAGWVWGSADSHNVYEVEHFINNSRIKAQNINMWEHDNRASCWVSNTCVAVAYNPATEWNDDATEGTANEIHLYQIADEITLQKKLSIPKVDLSKATFRYSKQLKALVIYSENLGVCIINLKGEVLYQDSNLKMDSYNTQYEMGIESKDNRINIIRFS